MLRVIIRIYEVFAQMRCDLHNIYESDLNRVGQKVFCSGGDGEAPVHTINIGRMRFLLRKMVAYRGESAIEFFDGPQFVVRQSNGLRKRKPFLSASLSHLP